MKNLKQLYAEQVKNARIAANYTQQELAEKIGISAQALQKIEGGQNYFAVENYVEFCKLLNLNPGALLSFASDEKYAEIDTTNLQFALRISEHKLTSQHKAIIEQVCKLRREDLDFFIKVYNLLKEYPR